MPTNCCQMRPISFPGSKFDLKMLPIMDLGGFMLFYYLCDGVIVTPRLGGGMVDTRDLKSLGPKRPCGFESRPGHIKKS